MDSALGQIPIGAAHVRGARSGLERTVPLLYFSDGEDVILIASSYGRPKFRRLVLQPQGATRTSRSRSRDAAHRTRAHEVTGESTTACSAQAKQDLPRLQRLRARAQRASAASR